MKKFVLICMLGLSIASYAAAAYQYFMTDCGKTYKIDARASAAEVCYWIDHLSVKDC